MKKFENIIEVSKKVVVFGGCGFVGSNIACVLAKLGNEVLVIDNMANGKMENIEEILDLPNVKFVQEDIVNLDKIIELTKGYNYFVQQAAYGSVPRSIKTPELYILNNELGTFNVFKAAIENGIEGVVYASSSSVYGDSAELPKIEHRVGNVLSPYSLTKKSNEQYASLFSKVYNLNAIGLRYFNIFGPKQRLDSPYAAVIPLFIDAIKKGETVFVNGDGTQSRDFTYVDNAILANLLSLKHSSEFSGEVYNVACAEQLELNSLIQDIELDLNKKANIINREPRNGDVKHSLANIGKIEKDLKYKPLVMYREGLKLTEAFYLGK